MVVFITTSVIVHSMPLLASLRGEGDLEGRRNIVRRELRRYHLMWSEQNWLVNIVNDLMGSFGRQRGRGCRLLLLVMLLKRWMMHTTGGERDFGPWPMVKCLRLTCLINK